MREELQIVKDELLKMGAKIEGLLYLLRSIESEEKQKEELAKENKKVDVDCSHPVEFRLNLTTMGGPEHWECRICGYEYIEEQNEEAKD